ncbi:GCN5-related protein N-acetyltransferase [Beutenbergia cavernae DSM 12333]|uniref:GCN5-related protein N-acetyltransferase n=1 Tax=Beutenbergia cavernae (strain ATCC BAA-8 / DSM 12333 / CCUG 43141 / JCM 11478 / NBRC 16432 / NCIMB 13614 / HKI 0122) TaxID=471853 RepID=C5C5J0_BEUC1|nr:GNAT family N-acetyltransferase [Beutenbergia cavernae]ACQ80181.1 GCN5-related protein N-acetyltransferase [Beutenbergia cavernae DSM 12333]
MTSDAASAHGASLAPLAGRAAPPRILDMPPGDLGFAWRALSADDLDALHALIAAIEDHDDPPYRTTRDEAAEMFVGDWKDPLNNTLGAFDDDGVLRAYGAVQVLPGDESTVRAFLEGGVRPGDRRRGVGTALLEWQVGRARQLLAASGKDLPARIAVFVDEGMDDTAAIVERARFAPRRWYTDMRRDLSRPVPEVRLDRPLVVAPWSEELDDQVRLAHNEAFADHWGSEPQTPETWADGRTCFAPQWSFLVLDKSTDRTQVAGYLLSGRYEQDWPSLGYSEGYTDILGVRRAWRGRRVATALLTAAMQAYAQDGMEYAALGVDTANPSGAFGLYGRLGYEPTRGSVMYSIEL